MFIVGCSPLPAEALPLHVRIRVHVAGGDQISDVGGHEGAQAQLVIIADYSSVRTASYLCTTPTPLLSPIQCPSHHRILGTNNVLLLDHCAV